MKDNKVATYFSLSGVNTRLASVSFLVNITTLFQNEELTCRYKTIEEIRMNDLSLSTSFSSSVFSPQSLLMSLPVGDMLFGAFQAWKMHAQAQCPPKTCHRCRVERASRYLDGDKKCTSIMPRMELLETVQSRWCHTSFLDTSKDTNVMRTTKQ